MASFPFSPLLSLPLTLRLIYLCGTRQKERSALSTHLQRNGNAWPGLRSGSSALPAASTRPNPTRSLPLRNLPALSRVPSMKRNKCRRRSPSLPSLPQIRSSFRLLLLLFLPVNFLRPRSKRPSSRLRRRRVLVRHRRGLVTRGTRTPHRSTTTLSPLPTITTTIITIPITSRAVHQVSMRGLGARR